ncbi:MAG: amidase, partial [Thermodesulfobacteriota bacterium]
MTDQSNNMDRRTFIRSGLAVAATLALAPGFKVWAAEAPGGAGAAGLPLTELAALLRKGELSATVLVQAYLDRIKKYDGRDGFNAYLTVAGEAALRRADELDRMAAQQKFAGPLHGLPLAVKDNLDTADIRTTGGSKVLADWRPPQDAHVIRRLKEAGAIILGKTNMHEFAFGITTNNPHYGPTRNPYDRDRIPGGSSGGSGAAVAASLCAGALGTDTGGSVRIPAALCGVVGLKPTLGRVGRGGLMYLSHTRDVIGPITRTVADAALMLEVLAGPDPRDMDCQDLPVPRYSDISQEGLKGRRFGLPRKYFGDPIDAPTAKSLEQAVTAIEGLGGQVSEVEVKHMDLATPTGFSIVLAEVIYLMEDYLKAFDPEATVDKYLDQLGPDVKGALGSQKGTADSKPVPG